MPEAEEALGLDVIRDNSEYERRRSALDISASCDPNVRISFIEKWKYKAEKHTNSSLSDSSKHIS